MARILPPFVVAVAVLFFSLALSHARIPANIPGNEATGVELPISLPESDANPIIRLPSDSQSHSNEPVNKEEAQASETLSTVQPVPLNVVTFRPVDHPFRLRSRFPSRCRHHHHQHHNRFFMPMKHHQEIPYGDDMILASGENADFGPGMVHGGFRRIPARWVKIHHHHHRHDDEDSEGISKLMFRHSDSFDKEKFKMHKHHNHDHEDDEERKEKAGGFFNRIRKILDHF